MFCFYYSLNQKLTLAQQQLIADYEKLKQDEAEKSNKLQELMSVDIPFSEKLNVTNRLFHKSDFNKSSHTFPHPFSSHPGPKSDNCSSGVSAADEPTPASPWSCFIANRMGHDAFERKINNSWSPSHSPKFHKNTLNTLTKNMTIANAYPHPLSIFHIHTLHLHLFISLTLILVTHKCPQYLIMM